MIEAYLWKGSNGHFPLPSSIFFSKVNASSEKDCTGKHRFIFRYYSALIVKLMKSHKNHLFNQFMNLSHHVVALGIKSIGSTHIHSVISHLMQDPDIVQALRLQKEFKNQ